MEHTLFYIKLISYHLIIKILTLPGNIKHSGTQAMEPTNRIVVRIMTPSLYI